MSHAPTLLPIESIRLLVNLLSTERLSKTADNLGITESVASRRLAAARTFFDDPLFIRSPLGYTPTQKMLSVKNRLERILQDMESLAEDEKAFDPAALEATVRIMTADSGFLLFLSDVVRKLRKDAPGLAFEIQPLAPDMFERLRNGATDFLIMPRANVQSEYAQLPLRRLPVAALVREGHPLAKAVELGGSVLSQAVEVYPKAVVD